MTSKLARSVLLLLAACGGSLSPSDDRSLTAAAVSSAATPSAPVRTCESLATLTGLPGSTAVTSATSVPAGSFTPPGTTSAVEAPAFCRVVAVSKPTSDSLINLEVWLPAAWNGKFNGAGNGGYGGSFATPSGFMVVAVRRGYATAGTDMGHSATITPPGSWALGHPEKIVDWAFRATHVTAQVGKAVIRAFYGTGPRLSYFTGCSDGGHEGLMEAQRYPADYQGIVAGASANFWTHQSAAWIWEEQRASTGNPASIVPPAKFAMITSAAVVACDAIDGVVDGLITDPRRCHFDPGTLLCSGADAATCLSAAQVKAVKEVYDGPRNPRTGQSLYPGLQPGGEFGWPGDRGQLGIGFYRFMAFEDPNWDFNTLDFDRDVARADAKMAPIVDSTSVDLRAFRRMGGKLLMYHGWNDPRVNPGNSIDYLASVASANRSEHGEDDGAGAQNTNRFLRLFMAPGMGHCSGGPGLNTFDTFTALENWVEQGRAPDKLIASNAGLSFPANVSTPGTGAFTRPLCVHPRVARWTGRGSTSDAANFVCAPAPGEDGDED